MTRRVRIPGGKLGKAAVALGGLAVISLAVALYSSRGPDAGATEAQDFADFVAARMNSGSEAVATVTGIPISMGKVKACMVFSSTGRKLGEAKADMSVRQFVDVLIANELLFQEAQRRGLVPSDTEAKAYAAQNKAALLELMKQDTQQAQDLRAAFSQVKGTPYGVDAYDSGLMLDEIQRGMAIGIVQTAIGDELLPADARDRAKRDAHVNAVLAELKSKAKITIAPLP